MSYCTNFLKTAGALDIRGSHRTLISSCTFKRNRGVRGGALFLQSGYTTIVDSQFFGNEARATTLCGSREKEGYGGAILLDSQDCRATLHIYNSSFVNNRAECLGSSVYSGIANEIVVRQIQFITHFINSSDTVWFSYSRYLKVDEVSFEANKNSRLGGKLFVVIVEIYGFSEGYLYFKCPISSILHYSFSSYNTFNIIFECQYCPKGTYILTPSNMSGLNGTKEEQKGIYPKCQSCSFGATCQRGIKPKPNFWGYMHKSTAFMILCPPGYCCQTSDQCTSLNSCNSNRAGRLCGK